MRLVQPFTALRNFMSVDWILFRLSSVLPKLCNHIKVLVLSFCNVVIAFSYSTTHSGEISKFFVYISIISVSQFTTQVFKSIYWFKGVSPYINFRSHWSFPTDAISLVLAVDDILRLYYSPMLLRRWTDLEGRLLRKQGLSEHLRKEAFLRNLLGWIQIRPVASIIHFLIKSSIYIHNMGDRLHPCLIPWFMIIGLIPSSLLVSRVITVRL